MEVISVSIATVATQEGTEVGELKAKVAILRKQLSLDGVEATGEPNPDHVFNRSLGYVGTTDVSEILLGNEHLHAPSRETTGPGARGDERCWLYAKSTLIHNRPHFSTKISD